MQDKTRERDIASRLGSTGEVRAVSQALYCMRRKSIDYTLDAHDGEHRARIYYRDKHGRRVQTEAQDRDAFTALRDALYQWVKATEEEA